MLKKLIGKISTNNFARSTATLISGNVIAQAISLLALPILTRIYTPEQFGHLASFSAILIIISGIACFRYEIAIPLPERDDEAINLLQISLFCTFLTFILTFTIIAIYGADIANHYLKSKNHAPLLWILPFSIAGSGIYNSLQYWAIRKKEFSLISKTKIKQSIAGTLTQLLAGSAGIGSLGLILGQVINSTAGSINLKKIIKIRNKKFTVKEIKNLVSTASYYSGHPKYSIIETLANSAGAQIPLILIAGLTTSAELGFLMLSLKVLQAPIGVIGTSISQVFFTRALEGRNEEIGKIIEDTIKNILKFGIGPLILFGAIAPTLLENLLGDHWRRSGEIITWLIPAISFQLIASPISMIFHIEQKQKLLLYLTICGFTFRAAATLIGHHLFQSATESFSLATAFYYFTIVVTAMKSCKIDGTQVKKIFNYSIKTIASYGIIGAIILLSK